MADFHGFRRERAPATGRMLPGGRQVFAGPTALGDGRVLEVMARLYDPAALALVGIGSVGTAALRSTGADIAAALKALGPMLRVSPARDARAARRGIAQIEALVSAKGIACADQVRSDSRFVRTAGIRLADAASPEA